MEIGFLFVVEGGDVDRLPSQGTSSFGSATDSMENKSEEEWVSDHASSKLKQN